MLFMSSLVGQLRMQKLPSAWQPVIRQCDGSEMLILGRAASPGKQCSSQPGEACAAFALSHCDATYMFCTPAQLNASPVLTTGLYRKRQCHLMPWLQLRMLRVHLLHRWYSAQIA